MISFTIPDKSSLRGAFFGVTAETDRKAGYFGVITTRSRRFFLHPYLTVPLEHVPNQDLAEIVSRGMKIA